ncbi:MAG: glycosyltransferase family 4 protein [Methylicorpusculum sp.]|uniref:glycosyltransferase family 4 protein n=1 Tax=Methylicorpusculum sp. TaxID=2713644 RepID=UPI0027166581|nr:glycosyltransferase family 4 protein [Methylicorpusculum sp.]MDZ4123961.1 glycosyltransferase family 4 protein [Hydrogenophaga sp.]MDO8845983.1 glycosyltransferase family 4 protein [Methylicorpusculum sp.]MDO8938528.1 glycosyltransferase family 4 protein [Methylicorpusculum sp.]MDO9241851.1 glycosyltransferase family 4 protein [Methylicorpusculum sp.]MDP2177112.1 glycosyltransferase family 4 protein [Methylicorpusculum sp.]
MSEKIKKNILYVENGIGYGGAIICLRHLVRNIDKSRYKALVVTGRTSPLYEEIAEEALWKYIADRHFDIVGAHQKVDLAIWPDKMPGARFIINQILARTDDIANFLPFFFQLLWTAWRFKADLIHTNNEPLCNRAALLVGKILKIHTISHVRGDQYGSRLMKYTFSLPDHFIPVSHWIAESMRSKLDISADKITVIYDGLELEKLSPDISGQPFRDKFNLLKDHFVVGLVGLLMPWKGQNIFIDATKELKDKIPNLKMLIIGGTPDDCISYENSLKERVKQENLEDVVIFTGHLTDMPVIYNGLDVVVSASTSPEPLGTVVIESMILGRPLIGPNHGGAAEMMEHNRTGLLFSPKNSSDLAEKIFTLYSNPKLREKLGRAAREKALKTFSVEEHVNQVQNIYLKFLHNIKSEN